MYKKVLNKNLISILEMLKMKVILIFQSIGDVENETIFQSVCTAVMRYVVSLVD